MIEQVAQRLQTTGEDDEAGVLPAIANWRRSSSGRRIQSVSIQTARALQTARKTRDFAERFGLLDNPAARLSVLVDSEESLLENVHNKNEYMRELAAKNPHLGLPEPLVKEASLAPKPARKPSRLDLIAQLKKSAKKK